MDAGPKCTATLVKAQRRVEQYKRSDVVQRSLCSMIQRQGASNERSTTEVSRQNEWCLKRGCTGFYQVDEIMQMQSD